MSELSALIEFCTYCGILTEKEAEEHRATDQHPKVEWALGIRERATKLVKPNTIDQCQHCGATEEEHHRFEAIVLPDGCVCDPNDWGVSDIPAVCPAFQTRAGYADLCGQCEHQIECHPPANDDLETTG